MCLADLNLLFHLSVYEMYELVDYASFPSLRRWRAAIEDKFTSYRYINMEFDCLAQCIPHTSPSLSLYLSISSLYFIDVRDLSVLRFRNSLPSIEHQISFQVRSCSVTDYSDTDTDASASAGAGTENKYRSLTLFTQSSVADLFDIFLDADKYPAGWERSMSAPSISNSITSSLSPRSMHQASRSSIPSVTASS